MKNRIATVTANVGEREEWEWVATCETTLGKELQKERASAAGRKAKEGFQSHDSVRSEQSWKFESPIRKVITRSADQGTWAEGGNMWLSPESASEGRTGSGIRNDVAGITWLAFEADVRNAIAIDFQYGLHRVAQLSEYGHHDDERDEGQKGRT